MENNLKNVTTLKSIAEVLNQSIDLEQALHQSLKIILDHLNLKTSWVFLKKQDANAFFLAAYEGLPPGLATGEDVWCGGCQCNSMARNGMLIKAVNMVRCSRLEMAEGDIGNLEVHASIPLATPRGQIGIFNVAARDGTRFSERDLQLLAAVGSQMGVAIERGMIFDQVRDQRRREQISLLKLSRALLAVPSLENVLDEILRVSVEIFDADMGLIRLFPDPGDPHSRSGLATTGLPADVDGDRLESSLTGKASGILNRLGRPGHILLLDEPGEAPDVCLFPMEDPVSDEDMAGLRGDHATWNFCRALGIRSILMAPIRGVMGGDLLGVLSIAHKKHLELCGDAHLTELLANQAALAIEQTRLNQIKMERQALEHDLNIAREIQTGFLPKTTPVLPGWQVASKYEAAYQVGGDFYDFIELPGDRFGIVIADVSGKGVPAALVMAVSRTLVKAVSMQKQRPLDAIVSVNRILLSENNHDRFLSLFYAELNPKTGAMAYVRAGHNPPMFWSEKEGRVIPLWGDGIVLGVADLPIFEEKTIQMEPGDIVLFYTDGLTEAFNANNRDYSETRLEKVLVENRHLAAEDLVGVIRADVADFVGDAPQSDDLTMIVLKRTETDL